MPKKIALLLLFLVTGLLAYDFSKCQDMVSHSFYKMESGYGIATTRGVLYYGYSAPKNEKILKHDSYLNLYLIEPKSVLKALELSTDYSYIFEKDFASINLAQTYSGRIKELGGGYEIPARLSANTTKNSIITDICYRFYGIGIGNGEFIESFYIQKFLDGKIYHFDIGVEIDSNRKVHEVNPFFEKNPFKLEDKILSIDGEKVESVRQMYRILALKDGRSAIKFEVLREGERKELIVFPTPITSKAEQDFRGYIGIALSDALTVGAVKENGVGKYFKKGDKILGVDGVLVENISALKKALSNAYNDKISFLVERGGFSFFIKIDNQRDLYAL